MPTVNIKDIPESKIVRLVDLSEDSINNIAESVVQKIAVDAVKVVRCKDCIHYWDGICNAHHNVIYVDDNDYCSLGEKMDEVDENEQ